jgi:anthranilate synthase component I
MIKLPSQSNQAPTGLMPADTPNLLPVVRELPADLETPVSIYLKLAGRGPSFLLESVTGGEQVARYSFIGVQPRRAYVLQDGALDVVENDAKRSIILPSSGDPLDLLRAELEFFHPQTVAGLPRLIGGLVGFLGYDVIPYFEASVPARTNKSSTPSLPQAIFLLADTLVAFDHAFGKVILIANALLDHGEPEALAEANQRLDDLESRLRAPLPMIPVRQIETAAAFQEELQSNTSRADFLSAVEQAREHIAAGDIFQVVLSQRLERSTSAPPFNIYRALRGLNPSPYMFFFDFDHLAGAEPFYLIGSSPEMNVRLKDGIATVRPIAGTRPRGATPGEDDALASELLADAKECAEHVMLVDLGRNDLGRVCEYSSIHVPDLMEIERYSHVMHIVSQVEGRLRQDCDAFDLLRATFPAGTVSGAPKIRAMQIIHDLENDPRGPYAGAVGYFSFDGSMDTCITIRTLQMHGKRISVQAGAGIVADSDPGREYEETLRKAQALALAVKNAEAGQAAGQA